MSQAPLTRNSSTASWAFSMASGLPDKSTFRSPPSLPVMPLGGTLMRQPVACERRWMWSPPLPMKAPTRLSGIRTTRDEDCCSLSRCPARPRPCRSRIVSSMRRLASSTSFSLPLSNSVRAPVPFLLEILAPVSRQILLIISPPLPMTLPTHSSGTSTRSVWIGKAPGPAARSTRPPPPASAAATISKTCSRAYSTHSSGPAMMMKRKSGLLSSFTVSMRAPLSLRTPVMVSPPAPRRVLDTASLTRTTSAFGSPGRTSRAERSVACISRFALATASGGPARYTARSASNSPAARETSICARLSRQRCLMVWPSFPINTRTIFFGTSIRSCCQGAAFGAMPLSGVATAERMAAAVPPPERVAAAAAGGAAAGTSPSARQSCCSKPLSLTSTRSLLLSTRWPWRLAMAMDALTLSVKRTTP
mmetsp:Transcript_14022/g.38863  ORF Transcript_14022/g.38863 Transcript_14022/m.38863 type:complete len:420 (-) Transcript_14022:634-1893(-)